MWLFTTTGFVSAVQDWNDPSRLLVRARDRASLVSLAEAASVDVQHTPTADYPYRVVADKSVFSAWCAEQAAGIDYPNFKSEVASTRGSAFARTLGKVWEVMHAAEDDVARHRPQPPTEPAPQAPVAPDYSVRPFTITRIQRPYPVNSGVLPDSTAVIAFGNPNTARVATLGINPSYTEFDRNNLLRLSQFGLSGPEELTDDQARQVARACYDYFTNDKTHWWFTRMERFAVNPAGASYFDGTACHLDITPWATNPVWSALDPQVREDLLAADVAFLRDQLAEHSFEVLLVNGRQALDVFQEEFAELEFAAKIPRSAGSTSSVYVGHFKSTPVIGWGLNVPDSRTSDLAREKLAAFLQDWFAREL